MSENEKPETTKKPELKYRYIPRPTQKLKEITLDDDDDDAFTKRRFMKGLMKNPFIKAQVPVYPIMVGSLVYGAYAALFVRKSRVQYKAFTTFYLSASYIFGMTVAAQFYVINQKKAAEEKKEEEKKAVDEKERTPETPS